MTARPTVATQSSAKRVGGTSEGDCYCPRHRGNGMLMDSKEAGYVYPYAFGDGDQFAYGVEIEMESELGSTSRKTLRNRTSSPVGTMTDRWSATASNCKATSSPWPISQPTGLIERIPDYGENAGGHIHVARTANQCASRWYWALRGLDGTQCGRLNMRHMSDDYWCELKHGEYTGKHTAVNDEHADTIELRTFDCWYAGSADKLEPAIKWIRAMWRFFEKHPRGTIGADTIGRYAACMADNVVDTPDHP